MIIEHDAIRFYTRNFSYYDVATGTDSDSFNELRCLKLVCHFELLLIPQTAVTLNTVRSGHLLSQNTFI